MSSTWKGSIHKLSAQHSLYNKGTTTPKHWWATKETKRKVLELCTCRAAFLFGGLTRQFDARSRAQLVLYDSLVRCILCHGCFGSRALTDYFPAICFRAEFHENCPSQTWVVQHACHFQSCCVRLLAWHSAVDLIIKLFACIICDPLIL